MQHLSGDSSSITPCFSKHVTAIWHSLQSVPSLTRGVWSRYGKRELQEQRKCARNNRGLQQTHAIRCEPARTRKATPCTGTSMELPMFYGTPRHFHSLFGDQLVWGVKSYQNP